MNRKIYKDGLIDWNECIYLYKFEKSSFLKNILNELYFCLISKTAIKLINKKFKFIEYDDLVHMGYSKFWELINNYKLNKKDVIRWLYYSVFNFFRNEIRKIEKSKIPMNLLAINNELFLPKNNFYCDQIFKNIKEFEYGVKMTKSLLFKKIYKLKKEGHTYESISKMLKLSYYKVKTCWDYYRQKIISEYGIIKIY